MAATLEVSDVSYAYPGRAALEGVSFAVAPGSFTALLGPNGAGKTTLFSLICRLFKLREGCIRVCGHDVTREVIPALARTGIVFQQPTLDLDLSVHQNLHYFAALRGMSRRRAEERIGEELRRLDLADAAKVAVRKLNGGHRRRIELCRALLHDPDLLLLDEPTVGLDVPTRRSFVAYVHQLTAERGVAALWATHLIDEVDTGKDSLVILSRGRVAAHGCAADIIAGQHGGLEAVYRTMTGVEEAM